MQKNYICGIQVATCLTGEKCCMIWKTQCGIWSHIIYGHLLSVHIQEVTSVRSGIWSTTIKVNIGIRWLHPCG